MSTKNTIILLSSLLVVIISTSLLVSFNDKKGNYTPPTFVSESKNHNKTILLADETFKSGNFQEALTLYKRVLASYPNNYPLLNKIGQIHIKLKELPQAKTIFLQLCKKAPDNVNFQTSLSFVFLELREYEKAKENAEKAILLRPVDGLPFLVKAAALAHEGKSIESLKVFENIQPTSFLVGFLKSAHFDPIRQQKNFIDFQNYINSRFGKQAK
ncbi:MAG: tetratricopeptide repeat protein [Lentisphaerales bacterium]|nr:tetratricopeptide repeat protein [Lentisphaerales bacterium]